MNPSRKNAWSTGVIWWSRRWRGREDCAAATEVVEDSYTAAAGPPAWKLWSWDCRDVSLLVGVDSAAIGSAVFAATPSVALAEAFNNSRYFAAPTVLIEDLIWAKLGRHRYGFRSSLLLWPAWNPRKQLLLLHPLFISLMPKDAWPLL